MYEKIDQPIQVNASFADRKVVPRSFVWGQRRYTVKSVNLVHTEGGGATVRFHFSVSDEANTFNISFNPRSLSWRLVEMYTD
jgi:hypothetical protein